MSTLRKDISLILGLVSFPVSVQSAVESTKGPSQVCIGGSGPAHELTKTKQRLACPVCDNDDRAFFEKAQEVSSGSFVLLPQEKVEEAATIDPVVKNTLTIVCHPAADVDQGTLPGEKFYYLNASPAVAKAYAVIANRVAERTDVAFTCEFAVKSVPALYRLGVLGGALVLKEIARPETITAAPAVAPEYDERMIPMADMAIDSLMVPFDPANYSDKRKSVIAEYVAAQTPVSVATVSTDAQPAPVGGGDLMAMLAQTIEANKPPAPVKKARKPRQKISA